MTTLHLSLFLLLAPLLLAPFSQARALDEEALEIQPGGDVKGFFFSVFPYDAFFLPSEPFGQSAADLRLKLGLRHSSWLRLSLHHQLTVLTSSADLIESANLFSPAPGQADLPQAVDLSWSLGDHPGHSILGRFDRASVMLRLPRFHLTLGRQPITFGRAYFFTPLDLVAPFAPTAVDREYKPGIDALRADYFFGIAGQVTFVAAYAGSWESEGMIFSGRAGTTLGGWDLALFGAAVRRDTVVGLESSGAIGPVAVRAEGSLTFPSGDEDPFVRVVAGADHLMLAGRLQLSGEIYHQSLGVSDPAELLIMALHPRVRRGEIWTLGRWYAAARTDYELTPLLHLGAFAVANLEDPSLLLGPSLSWSVADSAAVTAGAHIGLGERPETGGPPLLQPQSELGFYPTTFYASIQAYF
ncbi:MAG: hypothetical protein ACOCVR_03695 [Myxococcota bacterium]